MPSFVPEKMQMREVLLLCFNIFLKAKSLWTENDTVRLVGLRGYPVLRAVKTW